MIPLNTIQCRDCLEGMQEIEDKSIDLVITDPPYNIGKADWDIIQNYDDWMLQNFKEYQRILKSNGSLYLFHNDFLKICDFQQSLKTNTDFKFKQLITWNKINGDDDMGYIKNRLSIDSMRNYYGGFTEYCLYYTFQDETGLEAITEQYLKPQNKFSEYLRTELKRSEVPIREIAALFPSKTGGLTGCVSNWLNGDNIITKEQYETIRNHLNGEYLRREYEDLRREYESERYPFNVSMVKGNDAWCNSNVWQYPIRHDTDHPTPKPVPLICNIITHSAHANATVLDPFIGIGTTAEACIKTGRQFIGFEKEPSYFEKAQVRIKKAQEQGKIGSWFE
jgi:site-specific DNA-methyltransferase (adenine-specific)